MNFHFCQRVCLLKVFFVEKIIFLDSFASTMMINHHVHEDLHAIVFGEGVLQLKLNMHNLIKLIKIIFYINKIK